LPLLFFLAPSRSVCGGLTPGMQWPKRSLGAALPSLAQVDNEINEIADLVLTPVEKMISGRDNRRAHPFRCQQKPSISRFAELIFRRKLAEAQALAQ
jgi:hypothetical protein